MEDKMVDKRCKNKKVIDGSRNNSMSRYNNDNRPREIATAVATGKIIMK
jgi:hypothetical protein